MKKMIFTLGLVGLVMTAMAQEWVSGSIGNGATPRKLDLFIRTTNALDANKCDNLVFTVRVPITAGNNIVLSETFKATAFSHISFSFQKLTVDDGIYYYYLVNGTGTVQAPVGTTIPVSTPFRVLELTVAGGTGSPKFEIVNLENQIPGNGFIRPQFFYQDLGLEVTNFTSMFFGTGGATPQNNANVDGDDWVATFVSSVLPVTFSSYKVNCNDKGSLITWTTANEQNSSHFDIEKNVNGTWTKIDQVQASGNSSSDKKYQYLDLSGGVAQYRLKSVDLDGRSAYSTTQSVSCQNPRVIVALYPIPARDNVTLAIQSEKTIKTTLQVFDITGRIVKQQAAILNSGSNNITLNISHLATGDYTLMSTDKSIELNKKFTIVR